jgi:HAD superfamily hydrolase (TIGR01549 family)
MENYMAIKNILFDLDNTLIKNLDDDALYYKDALSHLGYDEKDYMNIYSAIDDYSFTLTENDNVYSKQNMLDFINNTLNKNYSISLIDEINKYIANYWIKYPFIQESTLKYLSTKYNLYVFTNWFRDAQIARLKNIGLLKYFKDVFASDYYGSKPFKNAFQNVMNKLHCSPSECIMIGDSKFYDILGAKNAGMEAILFDFDGTRDKSDIIIDNYSIITDLKQLENIL